MKRILLSFLILHVSCLMAVAQSPQAFSYQGVARDGSGTPLSSQGVTVRFTIRQGTPTGTAVYQEEHQGGTNALGLFTFQIGQGSFPSANFSTINWASGPYHLQVELHDGSAYQNMGTSQLLSVPYALYAATSGSGSSPWTTSGTNIYNSNTGTVGIGTTSALAKLHVAEGDMVVTAAGAAPTSSFAPPVSGEGRRMMWHMGRGAFRVGYAGGTEWDHSNIGRYSFAAGFSTTASGQNSSALGQYTVAPSFAETALGRYNTTYTVGTNGGSTWNATDRLFSIGNGDISGLGVFRSNALTVLKNGNMAIGNAPFMPIESRLVVAASINGFSEGGQIQLNSPQSGTYTYAAYLDIFEDRFRIMYGQDDMSLGVMAQFNLSNDRFSVMENAEKPGGGMWVATSDARLKQDVAPYTEGLDAVLAVKPVTYRYKEATPRGLRPEHVGVIAQELREVSPRMVGEFDKDGETYLNVDPSGFTYMLINAVKEQQTMIDGLKREMEQMRSALEAAKK